MTMVIGGSAVRTPPRERLRVAEFFAGAGLVRRAIEQVGGQVVFANDIEPFKAAIYGANFGRDDFRLGDVRDISGNDIPDVDLATASFPCTDLSLAGMRAGLAGSQSGMFWEFARVIREMGERRPRFVLLENVPSFATSRGGQDFHDALAELNNLGYICDALVVEASWFVPQSRSRLFVIGSRDAIPAAFSLASAPLRDELRPRWLMRLLSGFPDLDLQFKPVRAATEALQVLSDVVEILPIGDPRWWDDERTDRFVSSLSRLHGDRLEKMHRSVQMHWATAYRRTRHGRAVWEIRNDQISGCLRTARGGSSRQAVVEVGQGGVRVRWMTAREYARLQGADDFLLDHVSENKALFALGDAVCVPAVAWLFESYLIPLLTSSSPRETQLLHAGGA